MKKPAVIIGKKQIIMACLTLILGIAVYVNYIIADGGINKDMAVDNKSAGDEYGDTEFVNAGEGDISQLSSVNVEEYFAQARMDKTAKRDETVSTLQSIMGGGDITENEAVVNALAAVELTQMTELESQMESLIKAQGFSDCLVYLDENDVRVVIPTEAGGTDRSKIAAIKDILLSNSKVTAQQISIFEIIKTGVAPEAGGPEVAPSNE